MSALTKPDPFNVERYHVIERPTHLEVWHDRWGCIAEQVDCHYAAECLIVEHEIERERIEAEEAAAEAEYDADASLIRLAHERGSDLVQRIGRAA